MCRITGRWWWNWRSNNGEMADQIQRVGIRDAMDQGASGRSAEPRGQSGNLERGGAASSIGVYSGDERGRRDFVAKELPIYARHGTVGDAGWSFGRRGLDGCG